MREVGAGRVRAGVDLVGVEPGEHLVLPDRVVVIGHDLDDLPESCEPTITVEVGVIVPVAVTAETTSPRSSRTVRQSGSLARASTPLDPGPAAAGRKPEHHDDREQTPKPHHLRQPITAIAAPS